jgi:outer membrane autotransporter protein
MGMQGLTTVANFERYLFTLPADIADGQSILTLTNSNATVDLGTNAKIAVTLAGEPAALKENDYVILIDSPSVITGIDTFENTSPVSTFGATDYSFDVAPGNSNKQLIAKLGKKINQDKAEEYLEGASARLGALASGADHLLFVLDDLEPRCGAPASGIRYCSLASIQGGNIRNRTGAGASIRHRGVNFLLGGALDAENQLGALHAGVFIEGGLGNYKSHNRHGRGDGNTRHHGVGAFAKQTFTNRFYLEGTIRLGRARVGFDGKGSAADLHYESEANYWGAHAGAGYDHPLDETASLDTHVRLLWTHQNSDTVRTRAGEKLFFDGADSRRVRLGARYYRAVDKTLRAHVGLAWEYEFDGRGRARLNGERIAKEPETRGHSALLETGVEWAMKKNWHFTATAAALFGQRKGLSGFVQASYRF